MVSGEGVDPWVSGSLAGSLAVSLTGANLFGYQFLNLGHISLIVDLNFDLHTIQLNSP